MFKLLFDMLISCYYSFYVIRNNCIFFCTTKISTREKAYKLLTKIAIQRHNTTIGTTINKKLLTSRIRNDLKRNQKRKMLLPSPDSSENPPLFLAGIVTDSGTMITKKRIPNCS